MSEFDIPNHEGTGVHVCCMDERRPCEMHRRETYDTYQGGAFSVTSAGGALCLLDPKPEVSAKMWDDLEVALSLNPRIEIIACAHTACAGAIRYEYLTPGLSEEEQAAQIWPLLDQVGQQLETKFRERYPDFTYKLQLIDIRSGRPLSR